MALIVEGTTLGECNTVIVEGSYADEVFVDGTSIWKSRCCSDFTYSNSSLTVGNHVHTCPGNVTISQSPDGLETSGNAARMIFFDILYNQWYYGDWVYASNCGVGNGSSLARNIAINFGGTVLSISSSGYPTFGEVTYDNVSVVFTGDSRLDLFPDTRAGHKKYLQSMNGLLRFFDEGYCGTTVKYSEFGDWITPVPLRKKGNKK